MKHLIDYPYFMKEIDGKAFCGEYGKCVVCGKKCSGKHWLAFGLMQQFHFCTAKHFNLFLKEAKTNKR